MFGAMDRIQELIARLTAEVQQLIRLEIQLAQAEVAEKVKSAGRALAYAAVAGVFAFFAVFGLLIAAIWGIGEFLPIWAAALIVTGVFLLLAGLVGLIAVKRAKRATPPYPGETLDTLRTMPDELKGAL
jgi:uncharacterized membrane protein YqjE